MRTGQESHVSVGINQVLVKSDNLVSYNRTIVTQAVPDRKEGTLSWFLSPQENKYMDSFLLFFKIINPFLFLNSFSAFFLLFSAFFDSRQDVDSFRFPVPIPVEVRPDVCQRLNCFPPRMKAMFAELKHHFSPSPSLLNLK